MANTFISLPAPAANGAGAWTDVSTMGALKTVTVVGNAGVFEPFVTIEASNESSPTDGFPLETFFQPGESTYAVACMWMRAVVQNYRGGGAPTVSVGANTDGATADQLPVTAGNGTGTAVDVSALPVFKTVQVSGAFGGSLDILISEDGGTTYSQSLSFAQPGAQSIEITADHMKVQRSGVPLVAPGTPVVWVAATASPGGGGGGGGTALTVTDGTTSVNPTTLLDLDPKFFTVTNETGGAAGVTLKSAGIISTARYTASGSETAAGFDINLTALG
ncbi:MAG TPA: hypothetical protein VIV58_03235, partial [Kofleriaceae bacterium]